MSSEVSVAVKISDGGVKKNVLIKFFKIRNNFSYPTGRYFCL